MEAIQKVKKGLKNPSRVPGYLLRKLVSISGRGGNVRTQDGNITFDVGGFVSARSRPLLLARHNYEVLYIQEYLESYTFEKSLEIGCGYGRLSPIIGQFAEDNVAIDINEEAITSGRGYYPDIDFDVQNTTDLGYSESEFGLVTTWTVLQHVPPEQINTAIDEIKRVLAKDGVLLMCEATRYPEDSGGHTWDRSVEEYKNRFSSFELVKNSYIDEIDRLPDMETPGRVMLFKR